MDAVFSEFTTYRSTAADVHFTAQQSVQTDEYVQTSMNVSLVSDLVSQASVNKDSINEKLFVTGLADLNRADFNH